MRHTLCKDESICELYVQMESCTKMHELVSKKGLRPRCVISPNMTAKCFEIQMHVSKCGCFLFLLLSCDYLKLINLYMSLNTRPGREKSRAAEGGDWASSIFIFPSMMRFHLKIT